MQTGEITAERAVVWSATDRPARLIVEYAATEQFRNPRRVVGPAALPETGHTAKVVLTGLPAGQDVFYRATFLDLGDMKTTSDPMVGRFRTAPVGGRDVTFVWSGDIAGQGWGINPGSGGHRIYDAMRRLDPDFFLCSGDTIYADGPIAARSTCPDGGIWRNVTTEEKSKVAETLDGVPRQLPLQPAGRAPAPLQRAGAGRRPVGRPRGHATTGTPGEILDDDRTR